MSWISGNPAKLPRPAVIGYVPTGLPVSAVVVRLGVPVTPLSPIVCPSTKPL